MQSLSRLLSRYQKKGQELKLKEAIVNGTENYINGMVVYVHKTTVSKNIKVGIFGYILKEKCNKFVTCS